MTDNEKKPEEETPVLLIGSPTFYARVRPMFDEHHREALLDDVGELIAHGYEVRLIDPLPLPPDDPWVKAMPDMTTSSPAGAMWLSRAPAGAVEAALKTEDDLVDYIAQEQDEAFETDLREAWKVLSAIADYYEVKKMPVWVEPKDEQGNEKWCRMEIGDAAALLAVAGFDLKDTVGELSNLRSELTDAGRDGDGFPVDEDMPDYRPPE